MDAMAAIRQTFFQECEDQLAELETGLLAMSEGSVDSETVNAVFRAVHSIKGGAGAFKLDALVKFTHSFETALDHVRSGKLTPNQGMMKIMVRAADVAADLVEAAREGRDIDYAEYAPVAQELSGLTANAGDDDQEGEIDFQPTVIDIGGEAEDASLLAPGATTFAIKFRPKRELFANANEPLLVLRELGRIGEMTVDCELSCIPSLDALDAREFYLQWTVALTSSADREAIEEVFEFVRDELDLEITDGGERPVSSEDVAALLQRIRDEHSAGPQEASAEAVREPDANGLPPETARTPIETTPRQANAELKPNNDQPRGQSPTSVTASSTQSTIRVEFDRVDRLINLVGELVINQAMLSQRVVEANFTGAGSIIMGLDELEHLTREIQESVMAIRAQPVKPLFQRMARIVRDVADATGKQVRLKTEGEGTEVDTTVVERLAEPLTHLIRNAVDHGIESPEKRLTSGKASEGVVRLTASHRSGRIVLEIADDGAGINRSKVKGSAIKKGLIPADAQLTDLEIDNLLFLPGFSTAELVSNISGRGVGLDVVKRSIQALGGRIGISSRPGMGSTFSLSLPLTLAVLDGMVVSVNGQTLVVPLTAIVETLKPRPSDVHPLGSDGRVMMIREAFLPLIDVGCELGFRHEPAPAGFGVAILVETEGGARSALLVDAIQDQRQVVIKSLEANYRSIAGIAAATILGDGRVALILDVDGIVRLARGGVAASELCLAGGG